MDIDWPIELVINRTWRTALVFPSYNPCGLSYRNGAAVSNGYPLRNKQLPRLQKSCVYSRRWMNYCVTRDA